MYRFTFGELVMGAVLGAMVAGFGMLFLLLFARCTCQEAVQIDTDIPGMLFKWGMASFGVWVLAVTLGVIRDRYY